MKEHPFNILDKDHYTDDRVFERQTFLQWVTRKPKQLKVFKGSPNFQIFQFMALKKLAQGWLVQPTDEQLRKDLEMYGKTITISKPPRYVYSQDDMNDAMVMFPHGVDKNGMPNVK